MDKLEVLDSWLINKLEKFSRWWQKVFGQDCFWWAKACLFIVVMACTVKGEYVGLGLVIFYLIQVVYTEGEVQKLQYNMLANSAKINLWTQRILLLIGTPFVLSSLFLISNGGEYDWVRLIFVILVLLSLYFISCDPLPPAKSKVRRWLESALGSVKETLLPNPQPVPVPIKLKPHIIAGQLIYDMVYPRFFKKEVL